MVGAKGSCRNASQAGFPIETKFGPPGRVKLTSGVSMPRKRTERLPIARTLTVSPSWTCWTTLPGAVPCRPNPKRPNVNPSLVWSIAIAIAQLPCLQSMSACGPNTHSPWWRAWGPPSASFPMPILNPAYPGGITSRCSSFRACNALLSTA